MSTDNFEKKDNLTLSKARAAVAPLTCNGRKSGDTHSNLKRGDNITLPVAMSTDNLEKKISRHP